MARKTLRELARLVAAERVTTPGYNPNIKVVAVSGNKDLRFTATVTIGATAFEVANDTGKIRVFADVDSALKSFAKVAEKGNGVYSVEVDTGSLLASSVPADLPSWAENKIVSLNKTKTNQQAVVAGIDTQLGLMVGWENGNAAQQAKKLEVQAQRACVVTDIAAIDTELARLAVIAAG